MPQNVLIKPVIDSDNKTFVYLTLSEFAETAQFYISKFSVFFPNHLNIKKKEFFGGKARIESRSACCELSNRLDLAPRQPLMTNYCKEPKWLTFLPKIFFEGSKDTNTIVEQNLIVVSLVNYFLLFWKRSQRFFYVVDSDPFFSSALS